MAAPPTHPTQEMGLSDSLSLKRTQLSAERTLMAWIRTSFSMISFGFTMGKFLEYLHNQPGARASLGEGRLIPTALIALGLISLVCGAWEFRHVMVQLSGQAGERHRVSSVGIIATLVALLGVLAFVGLFFRIEV